MSFFRSKYEKELDLYLERIQMNMSNNYKDAAQLNFKEFEEAFLRMKEEGVLKPKVVEAYESQRGIFRQRLKGYTHKDQKPYWQ